MKNKSRLERQREGSRREILEGARRIVVQHGFAALTMRRLAEEVEYSPAALYQYFRGRDEIAEALSRLGFEELLDVLKQAEGFPAMCRAYVEFGLQNADTYRLMFMDDPQIADRVKNLPDDPGTRCYELLKAGVAGFRGQADESWADSAWCFLHGLVSLNLTCPGFPATQGSVLLERLGEMLKRT